MVQIGRRLIETNSIEIAEIAEDRVHIFMKSGRDITFVEPEEIEAWKILLGSWLKSSCQTWIGYPAKQGKLWVTPPSVASTSSQSSS